MRKNNNKNKNKAIKTKTEKETLQNDAKHYAEREIEEFVSKSSHRELLLINMKIWEHLI